MADRKSSQEDVFDVERVRNLVELMKDHDLAEIVLCEGEKKIKLRRGGEPVVTSYAAPPMAVPVAAPAVATQAAAESAPVDGANIILIKSPMVGTFYTKPKPDAENFVKVGDHISSETTVCIIEAMKVFNEIPADCSGKIVAVLVENEQPVDVDKPLFKVDTSG